MSNLQAPFIYFGGKSRIAPLVWQRFGNVPNYVEPFFGSGAVLLARPEPFDGTETVNDLDGMIANFWRAVRADPDGVAEAADWPVNENDLHARHYWLIQRKPDIVAHLEGDPEWYDAKAAGWWCWGLNCWIGSDFCSGKGPWHVVDGRLVRDGNPGQGVNRQLPHLGGAGQGVNRQRPIYDWFAALSARLRRVRVCCGDWSRVCGDTPTIKQSMTAVFLDPPYADTAGRDSDLYTHDSLDVAHDVREWAIERGDNPLFRIALCGYKDEHVMPESWECLAWKTSGGYASQGKGPNDNAKRERVWFSPHCIRLQREAGLFGEILTSVEIESGDEDNDADPAADYATPAKGNEDDRID